MESIRRARAMCRGIGERVDNLQLLDDRSRPPVRDDERQCVFVVREDVNEIMSSPSISVLNCGRASSLALHLRQS